MSLFNGEPSVVSTKTGKTENWDGEPSVLAIH